VRKPYLGLICFSQLFADAATTWHRASERCAPIPGGQRNVTANQSETRAVRLSVGHCVRLKSSFISPQRNLRRNLRSTNSSN